MLLKHKIFLMQGNSRFVSNWGSSFMDDSKSTLTSASVSWLAREICSFGAVPLESLTELRCSGGREQSSALSNIKNSDGSSSNDSRLLPSQRSPARYLESSIFIEWVVAKNDTSPDAFSIDKATKNYPYISMNKVTGIIAEPPSGSRVNSSQIMSIVSKRLEPRRPTATARNFLIWHFRRNLPIIMMRFMSLRSKHRSSHLLRNASMERILL